MAMANPSMVPPFVYARSRPVSEQERVHRRQVLTALSAGERLPESTFPDTDWFVRVPHSILRALVTARQLTATQLRYLLCVLEYSHGFNHPDYAIADLRTRRVPTLADWSAWLGGMHPKQVLAARRALVARGIIHFVDEDPAKVALNSTWESWDAGVFASRAAQTGAGRPRRCNPSAGAASTQATVPAYHSPVARVFSDGTLPLEELHEEGIGELPGGNSPIPMSVDPVIPELPFQAAQPRCQATSYALPKETANKELKKEETPAAAGAARCAPADRATSSPEGAKVRHFPSPPMPERLAGETSRVYWTRAFLAAEAEGSFRQRVVVHAAAHAVLGLELTRVDLTLLGQLRKAAGSWGTVLHWVLKTGDAAVVDVRAYLYGFIRQMDASPARDRPPKTSQTDDPVLTAPIIDSSMAPPDEDLTPTLEDSAYLLELRLRASGLWERTTLDRVPPNEVQTRLLALGALCQQASWGLGEGVTQIRQALRLVSGDAQTPAAIWPSLVGELEHRVQDAICPRLLTAP